VCGLLSQTRTKLQYPTSQEARLLLDISFSEARKYVIAYKSESLLLGLDRRINLSASSGIGHFVVSVCRHVGVPSNFWLDFLAFLCAALLQINRSFDMESPRQRFRV
jgi:hypothetical protein